MDYNSNRKKLLLPEYGRHIQKMVDHCVTIQDKEERTKCANSIIGNMGNMFPHLRDVNDFKHKLWDHLAIMSDFKLDIETPFELPQKETLYQRPEKMPYSNHKMRYRHYGRTIEKMIEKAAEMEEGEHKKHLIMLIANNMKKSLLMWNKDFPGDERVFSDIKALSRNKIEISSDMKIPEHKEYQTQSKNRKKRPYKKYDDRK